MANLSVTIAPPEASFAYELSEPDFQSNPNTDAMRFSSTPSTAILSPNARALSCTRPVDTCTPGTFATVFAASGSIGDQPSWPTST